MTVVHIFLETPRRSILLAKAMKLFAMRRKTLVTLCMKIKVFFHVTILQDKSEHVPQDLIGTPYGRSALELKNLEENKLCC